MPKSSLDDVGNNTFSTIITVPINFLLKRDHESDDDLSFERSRGFLLPKRNKAFWKPNFLLRPGTFFLLVARYVTVLYIITRTIVC